jgi:nucleoside-diphosphate-sugar epimerase
VSDSGLSVVFGGTGGIGSSVVAELAAHGKAVRAVSRGEPRGLPEGTEHRRADSADAAQAAAAAEGAAVVYHCAQPDYTRWPQDFPPLTQAVTAAAEQAGAKLVLADNLYMYGPADGELTEDTPVRPAGPKGRVRAEMAEALLEAHRSGRVRVAIGRASDYYGPRGTNSALGDRLFRPLLEGKRVRWLGALDVPHTEHFLLDIARGLITLGERTEADGEVFHLPAAVPVTGRNFLDLLFVEIGVHRTKAGKISPAMVRAAGLTNPTVREVGEVMYQWTRPFVSDWSKFRRVFGPQTPIHHEDAVERTLAWYRANEKTP